MCGQDGGNGMCGTVGVLRKLVLAMCVCESGDD